MFCFFFLPLALFSTADSAAQTRLAVISAAPDFALTTQDGSALRLRELRGKVVLVSFIFTTCSGTCPATTHRLAQIQQDLKNRGTNDNKKVHFVSISLDPTRDTSEVLRDYVKLYNLDTANWSFVTGSKEDIEKVLMAWGMWARPAANGQIDHPSRVYLADAKGRIREIYNLDFLKPAWVIDDMQLLLENRE